MEGGAHTAGALLPRCPGAVQTDHGLLSAQEVPCSMTRQPEMAAQLVPAQARQGAACAGSTCAGHSNCRPSARAGLTSLDRRAALSGSRVHTRRVWGRLHAVWVKRGAVRHPVPAASAVRRRRVADGVGGREGRRARGAGPGMKCVPSVLGGDVSGWLACPGGLLTRRVDVAELVRRVDHVCPAAGVAGGRRASWRRGAFEGRACLFTVRVVLDGAEGPWRWIGATARDGAGATLLFLLAGVSPSTMPSSRLRVDFRGVVRIESGRLEATVARLLEPSPEDRFGGAGEALAALRGTAPDSVTSNSNSNGGRMGGRMFDRPREGSEDDAEDETDFWNEREESAQSAAVVQANTTAPRRRMRKPAGTRVICERVGSSKLRLVIPPKGLTPGGTYVAGFALAWNSFVAFWTVSALASGGGLLFAAFSIPFWLAGKTVAMQAFDEIFEATALEFDAFGFEFTRTATGLVSDGKAGEVADVSGCGLVVESVTNGENSMCLELEYGAEPVRFGRGLARVELEYVCGEVNSFLDELKGASPLD